MSARDATLAYRDAAFQGASSLELVVLLYERLIQDIQRAATALRKGEIEIRSAAINHAFLVLQQLQGTLDFEAGGVAARQLDQFYNLVRAKLLEAQIRQSSELLLQQAAILAEVRNCWITARRLDPAGPATPAVTAIPAGHQEGNSTASWKA